MEILYTEYICNNCGITIENIRSIHLDVPCKLDVECPECKKKKIVLLEVKRMVSNEEEEND